MKFTNPGRLKPDLRFLIKAKLFLCVFTAATITQSIGQSRDKLIPKGEDYKSFTGNGTWCWFSDPRALYFKGKHSRTYAGWVDSTGNIIVGFYDHDLKRIETTIVHKNFEKDDHDNPSLFMDRQGKLMVFYSKHASNEPIYLLKSKHAEDISDWESPSLLEVNDKAAYPGLSQTYTYANVCQLADENDKLYLFWRGADFKPNFSISQDGGKTWSPGKILILPDRIYKERRPYLKVASNNKDVIHFAFTDGHPHVEPTNSIYYARYHSNVLYKANGEKIANWSDMPVQPNLTDIVYDATKTNEKAWIWDVAENRDGEPVIVYSRFPNDSNHVYYYSVWTNNRWNSYKLINSGPWFPQTPEGKKEREPNYSGGIVLDHSDPSVLYLSRLKGKKFEIEKWRTPNKGKKWKVEMITDNSENNNVRPFVILNYPRQDSLRVLWMNTEKYIHWTDYQSSIKMDIRE